MLFPTLYPNGKHSFNSNYIKSGMTLKEYIKMRLLSCRLEYRMNIDWVFWMFDRAMKEQILSYNNVPLVNQSGL